jgi:hypothetical protein
VPEQVPAVLDEGLRPVERGQEPVHPRVRCLPDFVGQRLSAEDVEDIGRIVRADGGGLGHTRTVEETVLVRLPDTPDLQRLLRRSPGDAAPSLEPADDHVENRSIYDNTPSTPWGSARIAVN